MRQIRRTRYLFIYLHDGQTLDLGSLLHGELELSPARQVYAISILCGGEYPLATEELQVLIDIPSDHWVAVHEAPPRGQASPEILRALASKGLILCDAPEFAQLLERDDQLSTAEWNLYAALYHSMTSWHDMHLKLATLEDCLLSSDARPSDQEVFDHFLEGRPKPPGPFHSLEEGGDVCLLPSARRESAFFDTLLRRRTTRAFETSIPLEIEDLSALLHYVFGCQGYYRPHRDVCILRKTSPSGGGLHPIEVYPLITNVRGLDVGLYHYNVERHGLEPIACMERREAEEAAVEFTAGQAFAGDAHVLFILAARFHRSFWKYRKHEKAYNVLLMDAGHLSQTHYLACTELDLGAFVTGAINDANLEERLGLNGFDQGVLAVLGCGIPKTDAGGPAPTFEPYVVGETSS